jgi:hypothetical protein
MFLVDPISGMLAAGVSRDFVGPHEELCSVFGLKTMGCYEVRSLTLRGIVITQVRRHLEQCAKLGAVRS